MLKIIIGLMIAAIDVGLDLTKLGAPVGVLELCPDFIGYLLVLWGSGEVISQNWRLRKYRWVTFVLFVYGLVTSAMHLYMDNGAPAVKLADLLSTAGLLAQLYIMIGVWSDLDASLVLHQGVRSLTAMLAAAALCAAGIFVCTVLVPDWNLYAFYLSMVETILYGYLFIKVLVFYRAWKQAQH